MKQYTLSIAPDYVQDWGFWEAMREILQNAYDQQAVSDCELEFRRNSLGNVLVRTNQGRLDPASLLLGRTTKSNDPQARGQFGEGYKLALLVLCRMGHPVIICNNEHRWTPRLEHDEDFGVEVLRIYVEEIEGAWEEGVSFLVNKVTDEQWDELQRNLFPYKGTSEILFDESQKGRVYVGGLFVRELSDFQCGYNLSPVSVRLDRDRGMIDGFDLSIVTSQLWRSMEGMDSKMLELLKQKAPDVRYLHAYAQKEDRVVRIIESDFIEEHGETAIPVSNDIEVRNARDAGLPFVVVSDEMKSLLQKRRPPMRLHSKGSPAKRLRQFIEDYRYSLNGNMKSELEDIAKQIEGTS